MNIDEKVNEYILSLVTENKRALFEEVLKNRTRHVTTVLENTFQTHNASAVLRTAECFGIQDVHIIENKFKYSINPQITLGSAKWINLYKHNTVAECYKNLKDKGYTIYATLPGDRSKALYECEISSPIALVFGTEKEGLSKEAIELADTFLHIPMYGFTESFNVSVSAAMCAYDITTRLRNSEINWQLSKNETKELRYQWAKKSVTKSKLIELAYRKRLLTEPDK
ncbi:MAG: TrmH family RNA methyltransferase [Flavobacteriales bacterium]